VPCSVILIWASVRASSSSVCDCFSSNYQVISQQILRTFVVGPSSLSSFCRSSFVDLTMSWTERWRLRPNRNAMMPAPLGAHGTSHERRAASDLSQICGNMVAAT
jgi:hypothetical protein